MNHHVWNDIINNEEFILNNKKMRIFPFLKKSSDYLKLEIDEESFSFITIREISILITKIICKHLINNNLNPLNAILIDSTAGVGGNALSFLKFFKMIYSVEICPIRYNHLINNINVYKYENYIGVNDNFCNFYDKNLLSIDPDVIFMDPPWGGTGYKVLNDMKLKLGDIDIEDIVIDIFRRFDNIKKTKFMILKLPKNYDIEFFYNKIQHYPFEKKNVSIYMYILNKMLLIVCELSNKI